ncbi:protein tyrosine kinase [Fragilaria crotonensis]|nr:protein tyrosine kinase [Fragilaria crotonensis]
MDVDVISLSHGDATLQQEQQMERDLAERFNTATQSEELPSEASSRSVYSFTSRLRENIVQFTKLASVIQQWLQHEKPERFAEDSFGFRCATIRGEKCTCTTCEAIAELKESCESFLTSKAAHEAAKMEHSAVMKAHAEAEKVHAEAKKVHADTVMKHCSSSRDDVVQHLRAEILVKDARLVSKDADLVAKDARLVSKDAKCVIDKATLVATKHSEVQSLLGALKTAGNETAVVTGESTVDTADGLSETRFDTTPQPTPSKFDRLCRPSAMELDEAHFLPSLSQNHEDLLDKFYAYIKRIFGMASRLDAVDTDYHFKIDKTVKGIIGWNVGDEPISELSTAEFFTPGLVAQESEGVQPILYAIMFQMTRLLDLDQHITREQGIPRIENRRARYIDVVVASNVEEYLLAILPAMLGVPIEIKPTARKTTKINCLLVEAQNQLIGHLAKRAMFSFDFVGIGEDCTLFGLELTMGSVAVIVLELSGVGTDLVKVTTRRTARVPLFDKVTREKLFGEKAKDVEASFEAVDEQHALPAGFRLLARTLMSAQPSVGKSLFASMKDTTGSDSCSMRSNNAEPIKLGFYLGSGAFSHVLKLDINGRDDAFVKVPKSHRMKKSLEGEAEALRNLRGHGSIPQLYDTDNSIKTLDIQIRCEFSSLPCLPLIGLIGQSTSQKRGSWQSDALAIIFNEVYSALQFAHGKGWAHLDVRPSNIIAGVNPEDNCFKVLLIDWGCACRTDKEVKGFVGCPPYAHDTLFGLTKRWTPCLNHDLASLVYSVARLSKGCVPWSGFSNHRAVTEDVRNCRFEETSKIWTELLETWKFSPEIERALHAIGYQGNMTRKRKKSGESL